MISMPIVSYCFFSYCLFFIPLYPIVQELERVRREQLQPAPVLRQGVFPSKLTNPSFGRSKTT